MEVDAGTSLVVVLLLMFFGSLIAGALPFLFQFKGNNMSLVAGLGGGLLLGTALSIVIPEGFHSMEEASEHVVHEGEHPPQDWSGAILVLGFLGMMALDRAQHGGAGGCAAHTHAHDVRPPSRGRSLPAPAPTSSPGPQAGAPGGSAVLGLLVHCAADGLALGAATLSGNAQLSFIVSVAMLAHKASAPGGGPVAPMAFGLATYLIGRGTAWREARRIIVAFAAAAPASAAATYVLLSLLPAGASSSALVARCLLASGGTFLYAATMHILPEVLAGAGPWTLAAMSAGALVPAVLAALGGGHAH